MNKIFLIGNLTGDPELRTTPNGITVCTMNLAVNRRFSGNREERQTDFYRVTAWRNLFKIFEQGQKSRCCRRVCAAYI